MANSPILLSMLKSKLFSLPALAVIAWRQRRLYCITVTLVLHLRVALCIRFVVRDALDLRALLGMDDVGWLAYASA